MPRGVYVRTPENQKNRIASLKGRPNIFGFFKKGHKVPKEWREKISKKMKGRKAPKTAFKKGIIPWNKKNPDYWWCVVCKSKNKTKKGYIGKYCSRDCLKIGMRKQKIIDVNGYILVYSPQHPNANTQGRVFEHHLVIEKHIGRYVSKDEIVHHKDGNRQNNVLDNLQIMTRSDHMSYHRSLKRRGLYDFP